MGLEDINKILNPSMSDSSYLLNENASRKREYSLVERNCDCSEESGSSSSENETSTIPYAHFPKNELSEESNNISLLEHQIEDTPKSETVENIVTCFVDVKKRIKTKRVCFYAKSQQTFVVSTKIFASNHSKNKVTNGTLPNGIEISILAHHDLTDVEEYSPECYIEHRFIGFLNIWEIARHSNAFRLLTQQENPNHIPRNIARPRPRRGSFFHPIQMRQVEHRRNFPLGRLSINNGIITRVIWSRGGPRTIIVRKQRETKKFLFPLLENLRRNVNPMYEYEYEIEYSDDYIETIRRITGAYFIRRLNNNNSTFSYFNTAQNGNVVSQNSSELFSQVDESHQ